MLQKKKDVKSQWARNLDCSNFGKCPLLIILSKTVRTKYICLICIFPCQHYLQRTEACHEAALNSS